MHYAMTLKIIDLTWYFLLRIVYPLQFSQIIKSKTYPKYQFLITGSVQEKMTPQTTFLVTCRLNCSCRFTDILCPPAIYLRPVKIKHNKAITFMYSNYRYYEDNYKIKTNWQARKLYDAAASYIVDWKKWPLVHSQMM